MCCITYVLHLQHIWSLYDICQQKSYIDHAYFAPYKIQYLRSCAFLGAATTASPRRRWRAVPGKASGVPRRRWCTGRTWTTSLTRWRPTPWLGELGFRMTKRMMKWRKKWIYEVIWSDMKWYDDGGVETFTVPPCSSKGHRCMCSCSSLAKFSGVLGESWLWCACGYRWPHSSLECLWRCTDDFACDPFYSLWSPEYGCLKKGLKGNTYTYLCLI